MRIVHRRGGSERIVEIEIGESAATVGALAEALGGPASDADGVAVDGVVHPADSPLSALALHPGSVVTTGAPHPTATPTARALAVIGGVRAGVAHPLATGQAVVVGRAIGADVVLADPTVSGHHVEIHDGVVRDLGSRNGTALDGRPIGPGTAIVADLDAVLAIGASRLALRRVVDDRPPAVSDGDRRPGPLPFHRPPRRVPAPTPEPLDVPSMPEPPPSPEPLSVAGIVVPLVAGGIVAMVFSPVFALFAALGPVVTVGTWWERRRRIRRDQRRGKQDRRDRLAQLATELPARRVAEIRRRRAAHPDPAEVVRRGLTPSVMCWERRPTDPDAFRVAVGAGSVRFDPPVVADEDGLPCAEATALFDELPAMPDVPIPLLVGSGEVVGVVGPLPVARNLCRSLLVQAAVHHGPAHLAVAAVEGPGRGRWAWIDWLPHAAHPATGRLGVTRVGASEAAAADRLVEVAGERLLLVAVDCPDPFAARAAPARRLHGRGDVALVVTVDDARMLPSGCTRLVRVDAHGRIVVGEPGARDARSGPQAGLGWGMDESVAAQVARRLARLDDPELDGPGVALPEHVSLVDAIGFAAIDAGSIEARWATRRGTAELGVVVGIGVAGPLEIDLVGDGPHVLVGGTTGSGKSELLRTLVASLALTADTDHVALVLVDYKGGAAFDCCAELPHVAGIVTDLDDDLAVRALACLEAELRHRERRLREVGADDLSSYRARTRDRHDLEPLPRLVVVVDEFAALAADLPDFLDALVGVAQRGRSLGMHLVLATQRPAGVVTEDLRANAGCRIALRVTDRHDSLDVIGRPDAAALPRDLPGRALARFGPDEVVAFQSALVTGRSTARPPITVDGRHGDPGTGPSDLRRIVDAVAAAHHLRGATPPRSPWPPPLPSRIAAPSQPADAWLLLDDPAAQDQRWEGRPSPGARMVVVGGPGSGTTSTLVAAALAAVAGGGPQGVHLQVIDLDGGHFAALEHLAHTGTVAAPTDRERRLRLLAHLDREVGRRRGAIDPHPGEWPEVVVVIDDLGGLARHHDPVREPEVHERLRRIWVDGPAVGVTVFASVRRAAELPPELAASADTVLVHRTTDPGDALRFGIRTATDSLPPGRAVRAGDGLVAQVAVVDPGRVVAMSAAAAPPVAPARMGRLADAVARAVGEVAVEVDGDGAQLRFAVANDDLRLIGLVLHPGEHLLVTGPARSGRTSVLEALAAAGPRCSMVVASPGLAARVGVAAIAPVELPEVLRDGPPCLVLIDDAVAVPDSGGALSLLVAAPPRGVHLVVATRTDRLRRAYGHWTEALTRQGRGLVLRPDTADGDLIGVELPHRLDAGTEPGRGVLAADGRWREVWAAPPGRNGQSQT